MTVLVNSLHQNRVYEYKWYYIAVKKMFFHELQDKSFNQSLHYHHIKLLLLLSLFASDHSHRTFFISHLPTPIFTQICEVHKSPKLDALSHKNVTKHSSFFVTSFLMHLQTHNNQLKVREKSRPYIEIVFLLLATNDSTDWSTEEGGELFFNRWRGTRQLLGWNCFQTLSNQQASSLIFCFIMKVIFNNWHHS